jgi:hypothetical protein
VMILKSCLSNAVVKHRIKSFPSSPNLPYSYALPEMNMVFFLLKSIGGWFGVKNSNLWVFRVRDGPAGGESSSLGCMALIDNVLQQMVDIRATGGGP